MPGFQSIRRCALRRVLFAALVAGLAVPAIAWHPLVADDRYPVSDAHILEQQSATEFVKRGDEAAARGDWADACYNYQQALERYPNHIVPTKDGVYEGLASRVSRTLRAFPPEGQKVYRDIYDLRASLAIEQAVQQKDANALLATALKYPLATDTPRALMLAAALLCESGSIEEAISAYESADDAETVKNLSPEALVRLAVALRLVGDFERLGRLAAAAAAPESPSRSEKIRVAGRDTSLVAFLKELARKPAAARRENPTRSPSGLSLLSNEWSHFFGSPARNVVMPSLSSLPPFAWKEDIPVGATREVMGITWYPETHGKPDISATQRPLHYPVVGLGSIFLHNDLGVWAFSIVGPAKRLLWKYENTRLEAEDVMDDERIDHTSTLSKGRLFVNLVTYVGRHEAQMGGIVTVKYPLPRRALMAFDARTGKLLWQLGGQPGAPQFPGAASFPHAPAADDGLLYVGGTHALHTTDPPDHYVFCVEPAGGKVRWSTFIASAVLDINLFNNPTREAVGTPVTVWQDLVFYCTNVGVVAALDKRTGRIVWLRRYEHERTRIRKDAYMPPRRALGWCNNPLLVVDGRLVVTPMDSPYIFLFDARTGKKIAKRTRADLRMSCGIGDVRYVIGAAKGLVFVSGPSGIAALSVTGEPILAPRWTCRFGDDPAYGRGAVTEDGIVVPCESSVITLDASTGKVLKRWPWQRLEGGQLGRNIVVMRDMVIAAAARSLHVYYSQQVLEEGLARELAAAPDDPEIMYHVGLSYLRAQKRQEGISLIENAATIAARKRDRESQALEQRCRRSLFDTYLATAELAAKVGSPEALAAYESAKRWAPDGDAFVLAALKLARTLRTQGALQAAAAQFSEVIVKHPDAQFESMAAADYARIEIANLISAHGRALYAPIEKQATALLETARKAGSHQMLLSVFKSYPNSVAAETALLEAAQLATKAKRWDDVIESLQLFLRHFPSTTSSLAAHLQLLEAYEAKQMLSAARSLLRTLVQSFPDSEAILDGKPVSMREFVQARLESEMYMGTKPVGTIPAALAPPLSRVWQYDAPEGTDLRVFLADNSRPGGAALHPDIANRVFLGTRDTIFCLNATSGAVVWQLTLANGIAQTEPCFHERYIIVASGMQVVAINAVTGWEAWTHSVENYVRHLTLCDGLVYAAAFARESPRDLRVFALDANTGATVWEQVVVQTGIDSMAVVGDYLVFYGVNLPVICVYDRLTGAPSRRIQLLSRVNSVVPVPLSSTVVVVSTDYRARRIDLSTGAELWSQTLGPVSEIGQRFAATEDLFVYFLLGTPRNRLVLIDMATGKMRLRRENATDGQQRSWWLIGDLVYASFCDHVRRMPYVQGIELLQGDVQMVFTPEVAHRNTELRPVLAGDHLVFACYSYRQEAPPARPGWAPIVYIVERKTGKLVQTLDSGEFELSSSLPGAFVVNGTLLVQQAQSISAFRGR